VTALDWQPAPGAAPRGQMLRAQAAMELRLTLRNLEQVGLTLVLPLLLTVVLNLPGLYSLTGRRIDFVVPSVMALSVMSAAFTGLAIGTGFERKYGVLKRLGATALPRSVLVGGKLAAVLALEAGQLALVCGLGLVLGWRPHGDPVVALALILLGSAAFAGLGLLLAGTLRAEVTLATANLLWFALLFGGGIAVPLARYPDGVATVLRATPAAALSDGLHAVLQHGAALPIGPVTVLLIWAAVALVLASRWFRWE
jgi:ABC-2 type transport system permease protein